MVMIERLLQPAALAICNVVKELLLIISRIIVSCEDASRGAMVVDICCRL
jgi:hypothetical protein